jgi:hypothetical protein
MSNLTFPEVFKIVQAHEPAIGSALLNTSDIVSCKNFKKLWAVLSMDYVDDVDLVVTWNESTDVAGGTTSAITATCPIWYNIDTATADLLTRATDAITFTINTGAGKNQLWIMEWDPAKFSAGYDCFQIRMSGAGASIVDVLYIAEPRYQSDVNVAAITD